MPTRTADSSLVSQCTAANNNRYSREGKRLLGGVAQATVAKVARTHIVEHRAKCCPQNQYDQRLLGRMGWGTHEHRERKAAQESKSFVVEAGHGLQALNARTYSSYSPQPGAAVNLPHTMSELLKPASHQTICTAPVCTTARLLGRGSECCA